VNLYGFVSNNAISRVDPRGKSPLEHFISTLLELIFNGEKASKAGKYWDETREILDPYGEAVEDAKEDLNPTPDEPSTSNSYRVRCYYLCPLVKEIDGKCIYGNCSNYAAWGKKGLMKFIPEECPRWLHDFARPPYLDEDGCLRCHPNAHPHKDVRVAGED